MDHVEYKAMVSSMRRLHRLGVTHFAVTDELYGEFKDQVAIQNLNLGEDTVKVGESLCFRGNRLLTQADLQHLPFECKPLVAMSLKH